MTRHMTVTEVMSEEMWRDYAAGRKVAIKHPRRTGGERGEARAPVATPESADTPGGRR
jgi:hypothetical protein